MPVEVTDRYKLECLSCNYVWETKYPRISVSCPSCHNKIFNSDNYKLITRFIHEEKTEEEKKETKTIAIIILAIFIVGWIVTFCIHIVLGFIMSFVVLFVAILVGDYIYPNHKGYEPSSGKYSGFKSSKK